VGSTGVASVVGHDESPWVGLHPDRERRRLRVGGKSDGVDEEVREPVVGRSDGRITFEVHVEVSVD
jgi:hypothetical protein